MMLTVNLSRDQNNGYTSKTELGKNTSVSRPSSELSPSDSTATEDCPVGIMSVEPVGPKLMCLLKWTRDHRQKRERCIFV